MGSFVAFMRTSSTKVEIYQDVKARFTFHFCIISMLKGVFFTPLLTTHMLNDLHSITYHETSKVQSEYTQSMCYMNICQFSSCLNCIPLIKFHFATLAFPPCHFIGNNLHFIMNSNYIVQPHWKRFTWN